MSKAKFIAIGICVLIAIGAGTAQYFWKQRRTDGHRQDLVDDRNRAVTRAAEELGRAFQSFCQETGRPPVDLTELMAHQTSLTAPLEALREACGGSALPLICCYVRPVSRPLRQQPLFVLHTGGTGTDIHLVIRTLGVPEMLGDQADTWWVKASELAVTAATENRGITAAEWGDAFLE